VTALIVPAWDVAKAWGEARGVKWTSLREASESEILRYCAILEGVSMIRLDFAGWSRSVTSKQLKSKCDKVSAFVLYRSIVDMKKVSLNDFNSVYQLTVKAENPNLDTVGVLKKCQDLYYLFNPQAGPANMREAPISLLMEEAFQPSIGHKSLEIFRNQITTL
jgi:hypothetical protein